MAQFNLSTISQAFKTLYPDGIESLVIGQSPLLGRIRKNGKAFRGFKGSGRELAWRIDNGGGVSADFATAQTRAGVSQIRKPFVTRKKLYVVRKIDHESMEASEGDAGAIVSLISELTTSAMEDLQKRAGSVITGDGTGAVGRISTGATVAGLTVQLQDPTQIVNFRVGGTYQAFVPGGVALRSAGAIVTITGINEDTGDLTCATNWSTQIGALVAGDMLVPEGDFNAVPTGIHGWNPKTLPTVGGGDSFYTVDRGGSVGMAGARYAPTAGSMDEVLFDSIARHARQGGDHNMAVVNPEDWGTLAKQIANAGRITRPAIGTNGKEIGTIGYDGLVVKGPKGNVEIFADPYMERYRGKLLNLSDLEIWSLNDPFRLLVAGAPSDGMVRDSGADGSELRYGGYWNMVCHKPRNMLDMTFPT